MVAKCFIDKFIDNTRPPKDLFQLNQFILVVFGKDNFFW